MLHPSDHVRLAPPGELHPGALRGTLVPGLLSSVEQPSYPGPCRSLRRHEFGASLRAGIAGLGHAGSHREGSQGAHPGSPTARSPTRGPRAPSMALCASPGSSVELLGLRACLPCSSLLAGHTSLITYLRSSTAYHQPLPIISLQSSILRRPPSITCLAEDERRGRLGGGICRC